MEHILQKYHIVWILNIYYIFIAIFLFKIDTIKSLEYTCDDSFLYQTQLFYVIISPMQWCPRRMMP